MKRTILISALLVSGACRKAAPEAPKELGELGAFLFANFEVEDEDGLADYHAGLLNLRDYLTGKDVNLADPAGSAVEMPILDGADLGGLKIPAGVSADEQVNRAVPGLSVYDVDAARMLHVQKNQICIESSTTEYAQREFVTDAGCWEEASCDSLETTNEVYKANILAKIWYDQYKNYRAFEVEDENGDVYTVVVGKAWIEKQFMAEGGGNNSWDQLFQVDVSIPDPAKPEQTLRWFSMWSSITLGGFSDDAYGNSVIDGIAEAYVYADEYIAGDIQTCKNDLNAARPDRTNN